MWIWSDLFNVHWIFDYSISKNFHLKMSLVIKFRNTTFYLFSRFKISNVDTFSNTVYPVRFLIFIFWNYDLRCPTFANANMSLLSRVITILFYSNTFCQHFCETANEKNLIIFHHFGFDYFIFFSIIKIANISRHQKSLIITKYRFELLKQPVYDVIT